MWSKEGVLVLIEDLHRDACLWDVHMQITKIIIKKGVATDVLAKKM
jgi:beta-galactosidase beta subunit